MSSPTHLPRREFFTTLLAAGFALAVRPSAAESPIQTPVTGLVAGERKIPAKGGDMPAYFARPEGAGPFPVVLVVQEIFGVHEYIRDVCRRLAHLGYLAVAPELFFRQGDPTKLKQVQDIIAGIVAKVPDEQVLSDLDAAAAWAGANGGDTKRMGITGFCWGGRMVWLYAAHRPELKAAVAWYGKVDGAPSDLTPTHPMDIATELKVPVLGLYGAQDQSIPLEDLDAMRGLLAKGKSGSDIHVYADAGHAFHADYRPTYRKGAADDGWQRLTAWFKGHGL